MQTAISVQGLSKRYRIAHGGAGRRAGYRTFQETLRDIPRTIVQRLRNPSLSGRVEDFWALRDVSFDVTTGEVIGIVGRNGAGKSTLLKLLTRITEPTSGTARLYGRVGSLLEVGTGFHPELTGRENIFLNGSILGMKRAEIVRQIDEIIDFAGVERFIDTPVKRYSSGMTVRLAFAVAAHLNPEILLIDEVLAVGDVEFQRRCLGKMGDISRSGRTVLFVSHNMAALKNLCPRSINIERGNIVMDGATPDVIRQYLDSFQTTSGSRDLRKEQASRLGSGEARIQSVQILSLKEIPSSSIPMGDGMIARVEVLGVQSLDAVAVQVAILGAQGERYCRINSRVTRNFMFPLDAGQSVLVDCTIPTMNLGPNTYRINLQLLSRSKPVDTVEHAVTFEVTPADVFGTGRLPFGEYITFFDADWELTGRHGDK